MINSHIIFYIGKWPICTASGVKWTSSKTKHAKFLPKNSKSGSGQQVRCHNKSRIRTELENILYEESNQVHLSCAACVCIHIFNKKDSTSLTTHETEHARIGQECASLRKRIEQLAAAETRLQYEKSATETTQWHVLFMMAQELLQLRQVHMQ